MAKQTRKEVPATSFRIPREELELWDEAAEKAKQSRTGFVRKACEIHAARILPLRSEPDYDNAA